MSRVMFFLLLDVLVGCLALAYAQPVFVEQLSAQNLLGSHFGIPGLPGSFDYVIVGGGTAGLTMARRLAADTSLSVAVIEAGDFYEFGNGNFSEIPGFASQWVVPEPVVENPYIDWYTFTTPQSGIADRSVLYPSGKCLGGSSARNFMWYHWSSTGAYQKWADDVGDDSYKFENFVPFYQKSAHFTPPTALKTRLANSTTLFDASAFKASGGPLQVGYPAWVNPSSSWVARGLNALGFKNLPGLLNGNLFGYTYVAYTIDSAEQTRSSSETSYLREALVKTGNLAVYKNTLVKQIVFEGKQASGVIVNSGGVTYQLNATKEVIVSAGALRSPQILLASGIGPADTLESLDIPMISNLPGVGQNMWDHVYFSSAYALNLVTHDEFQNPAYLGEQIEAYVSSRTGALTNVAGDILGFGNVPKGSVSSEIRAALDADSLDWPDYEHLFLDAYLGDAEQPAAPGVNYVSSFIALVHPFSRGNVTIASKDTSVNPVISPNWLTDPRDQAVAVAAFKQGRAVFVDNPGTAPIVIGSEAFPGLNVSTDAEILQVIQASAESIYHAAATCAMGKAGDEMAVIDSKARVFGVKGLRVVDASSFPFLPPGHPSSTVYALAEKIAHDILAGS